LVLADKANAHRSVDIDALFAHSRKAWSSDASELIDVVVRLSARAARLASEYPLVDTQTLHDEPGGAVTVHARVAGVPETMRWVEASVGERGATSELVQGKPPKPQTKSPDGSRAARDRIPAVL
jgi:hypothetical protein